MGKEQPKRSDDSGIPPSARVHIWQIQAVRDVMVVAVVLGMVWAGYAVRSVTVPLLVALALAYLFEPLVARMTKGGRLSRPFAVSALICTVGVLLIGFLALAIPLVVSETVGFVKDARRGRFYQHALRFEDYVPIAYRDEYRYAASFLKGPEIDLPEFSPEPEFGDSAEGAASAPEGVDDRGVTEDERIRLLIRDELSRQRAESTPTTRPTGTMWLGLARSSAEAALGLLGAVLQLGLLAFLIPFYFFFFSVSYPQVVEFARDLIPRDKRGRTLELVGKMDSAVAGFVRGRLVTCAIVGLVFAAGWMICGVPYAIALGLLIGAFNAVPYLSGIGLPFAIGLLALEKASGNTGMAWWGVIVWPTVVFAIGQVLDGYVLTPIIAGKATDLDPVTILVAVLAGGSVGGLYGMLLAIPVFACAKILIKEVLMPRVKAWTRGEASDPLPIEEE